MSNKTRKLKLILALFISRLPFSKLRICCYCLFFDYLIVDSKIGWGTVILANEVKINRARIGSNNLFIGPIQLLIEAESVIGDRNEFRCDWWVIDQKISNDFTPKLYLGEKCLITNHHYFDLAGSIEINSGTWIAGQGSQFWTHGAGSKKKFIYLGSHCYVSSAVRISPGSIIGNDTLIALGSVVTNKFEQDRLLIGGNPATIIRENYDWRNRH